MMESAGAGCLHQQITRKKNEEFGEPYSVQKGSSHYIIQLIHTQGNSTQHFQYIDGGTGI
jgi:hypothetical protein